MVSSQLIKKLADSEGLVVPILFKPVQFNIIRKLNEGDKLNENEKRYLRGQLREKLAALDQLNNNEKPNETQLLDSIGSYYITGLEALKHNGYGWYFEPKIVEVINTKIEGSLRIGNRMFRLIRAKSIEKSEYTIDTGNGLRYATNDQVFQDAKLTKNEYVKKTWLQMLSRYGKLFVKNYSKFKQLASSENAINLGKFGV